MDQNLNKRYGAAGAAPGMQEVRPQQNLREEEEVDLREIISLLLHHVWIFALAALIGALLVGLGVKLFIPAKYTAKATIYVFSTTDTSSQTISTADKMTTDFQIIATTSNTIQMVIDELELDQTVAQLKSENQIKVTNPTDSHNSLASVMCDQIAYIMKSERPQFVEPAALGTKTSPYVRRDAMIGGVAAALIAVLVVLVRYFVNDTITTEEDVNRYLGLTILSSVPLERNLKS